MTQQQTTFARSIATGAEPADALRTAYPDSANWRPETVAAKASALAENPAIVAAVQEMRVSENADGDGKTMTMEEASLMLTSAARRIHSEHGRPADLVRCIGLLARLGNWRTPEPDSGLDPADLTDEELGALNVGRLYGNGPETADEVRAESLRIADAVRRERAASAQRP